MHQVLLTIAATALIGSGMPGLTQTPPPRCACGQHETKARAARSFANRPRPGDRAICPVTKRAFTVTSQTATSLYKGRYYAFCCPGCKPKFDKNPGRYAGR